LTHPPPFVPHKKPRTYTSVVFETPAAVADEAGGILIANGALGCEVIKNRSRRPDKRKPVHLRAWFQRLTTRDLRRINTTLDDAGMLIDAAIPTARQHLDPGWATMWQARFEPFEVGRRFLIVPPWKRALPGKRLPIIIRPGQAFGTGHHPSTAGTLTLIERVCARTRVSRALDLGTGSGILAIALHKLGVAQIIATDIDATALENARENAELNGIERGIRFSAAPLASIRGRFDLITANILAGVLIEMAPRLKARLRPGGRLILAGILSREAASVAAAYRPELRRLSTRVDGNWTALMMGR
jgi:ribosomal protein L11 methyltransferase